MEQKKILVIGSSGQIGTELVEGLRARFGNENVVASDIKEPQVRMDGPFAMVDAMDRRGIERIIEKYAITEVYLLAALLSATAEKDPAFAWKLNMESLFIVLELAREGGSNASTGPAASPCSAPPRRRMARPSIPSPSPARSMASASRRVNSGATTTTSGMEWMFAVSVIRV
jgi:nucleoside-diphosphate-sugar epimerase